MIMSTYNFAFMGVYDSVFESLSFFLLLYGMPAPSTERQHPEEWPASTYGYLTGVPDNKKLLSRTLPDNNLFLIKILKNAIKLHCFEESSNMLLDVAVEYLIE